jgi:hypothetical protein
MTFLVGGLVLELLHRFPFIHDFGLNLDKRK